MYVFFSYLMYRWPLTSALFGCVFNFVSLWVATSIYWVRNRVFSVIRFVTKQPSTEAAEAKSKAVSATPVKTAVKENGTVTETSSNETSTARDAVGGNILKTVQAVNYILYDFSKRMILTR